MTDQPGTAAETATAYDAVAYPTTLFPQTAPDRMATIAMLAGLDPPAVATARVLELAAGDGLNLIALAAAWPDGEFVGIDLAASAIARGRKLIAATGLSNVRLDVMDLRDAADRLDGEFDYIIAHGVYAWVPPDVREATMALIGRLLSPSGMAYVSYNALPGGYLRMALRDALLFAIEDVAGEQARLDAAYANLEFLVKPVPGENAAEAAMRYAAEVTMSQAREVLHHDELGEHYHPQSLRDVVSAAQSAGLRFLGDAGPTCLHHAFIPDGLAIGGDPETELLNVRQAEDYREVRFFRSTLLVRDAARPARRFDGAAMDRLFAACSTARIDAVTFRHAHGEFEIDDPDLAIAVGRLVDAWPTRVPVTDLPVAEALRVALFELFDAGYIQLRTTVAPFSSTAGDWPCASPLARVMAVANATMLCTLDHRLISSNDTARALLPLLDGSRDRAALADAMAGQFDAAALDATLDALARDALLLR